MKMRTDARYKIVVPTSIGVRITPENRQPVESARTYMIQSTSAESNVAQISASLGLPAKLLTTFVADNAIATFIKNDLRFRGLDYEGPSIPAGGPWGYRHQFNIADSGYGARGPYVQNDRAGEVGRTLNVKDFDLDRIFGEEGATIVHMSGLIAALSPNTSEFCLQIARHAKKSGSLISFDLNHRASFWAGREEELRAAFLEIAGLADILIGNEEDYQLALGIKGPDTGQVDSLESKIAGFKKMILRAHEAFPSVKVFANTLREVVDANNHLWGAILYENGNWHVELPRSITVLDRIGGGDGFVGGLLYAIASEKDPSEWIKFAWATGALATTMLTDYATPVNEAQIRAIYEGNARVQR